MLEESDSNEYPKPNPRSAAAARQRRKETRVRRMTKAQKSTSGKKQGVRKKR